MSTPRLSTKARIAAAYQDGCRSRDNRIKVTLKHLRRAQREMKLYGHKHALPTTRWSISCAIALLKEVACKPK